MTFTQEAQKIITNLHNQVITQTVLINVLCDILVESDIISKEDLVDRINSDLKDVEKLLSKINSKKGNDLNIDDDSISDFLTNYTGPMGEA